MRKSHIFFLSCGRQSVDSSIACTLQVFASTKCLLYRMQWEELCKRCKASQRTTLQLTPVDGPARFCKPHCGIRTFTKALISFLQCCIYCIPRVLQVHDLSSLSLATIPCKQFLFCAGETNTPPINCFTADWGKGSCSLSNRIACFL